MSDLDLNRDTLADYRARVDAITDDSQRQWGTMTAAQMFAHMTESIRASIGEVDLPYQGNFVLKLMRPLVFTPFMLNLTKGKADTAPEFKITDERELEAERSNLQGALERFVDFCEANPDAKPVHTMFGAMTIPQWQTGHGVHFDYHLRQFGV